MTKLSPNLQVLNLQRRSQSGRSIPSFWAIGGLVGAALFAGLMTSCIVTLAIWPGEARLFAPILCDSSHPDSVVVYDTYSARPGETTTTFSMYCMGPRGDVVEHGWGRVFLYATAVHTLFYLCVFSWIAWRISKRVKRTSGHDQPPDGTASGLITQA